MPEQASSERPAATCGQPHTFQWRITLDGYPGSGCWIDVADGDFQNLHVTGRLEFRAKPEPPDTEKRALLAAEGSKDGSCAQLPFAREDGDPADGEQI